MSSNTREFMERLIRDSSIFNKWHWFHFHFDYELNGRGHPFARGIIDCMIDCEARLPGYAARFVKRLASISGKEHDLRDWMQLLTVLAEHHVVAQICRWHWPESAIFTQEPTAAGSRRNPELSVEVEGWTFGYEVKAPDLVTLTAKRYPDALEISSRFSDINIFAKNKNSGTKITLPRDNTLKDFLTSAEQKFQPFCSSNDRFVGILVVCWDDYIHEPISALVHPECGLLTPNSYHRTDSGRPVTFPSVGGVVLIRQLHQLYRSCKDEPLGDGRAGPFDYGEAGSYPFKVFYANPASVRVPPQAINCLQAVPPERTMGAEYHPKDVILWLG